MAAGGFADFRGSFSKEQEPEAAGQLGRGRTA